MRKILPILSLMMISVIAHAKPNYSALSKELYPTNSEDQAFVSKFFEIVEGHKTNDPLLEGRGPSIAEYSLDKIKFAFMTNLTEETVDLVFFNWKLPVFQGLELNSKFSLYYESPVYVMKNVNKKSIASQGQNRSEVSNFSYILGANVMLMKAKKDNPKIELPPQILDWKPNPSYMDRSHPLRQTLNINTLAILSPTKEIYYQMAGITAQTLTYFEKSLAAQGGYVNSIMGMMVHELFHVKEGEDQINDLAPDRKVNEDRKAIMTQLQQDAELRSLVGTYVKIVFSLADSLKNQTVTAIETHQLSELGAVIAEFKTKSPETWKFIWNYEYTEGFAEYVSAYTMIQVGVTPLALQLDYQKADSGNNFAYRTGAIGGLYLANRFRQMPFAKNEDHQSSVWELVLRLSKTPTTQTPVAAIQTKYTNVPGVNSENEVKRVIDYLVSTVMTVN